MMFLPKFLCELEHVDAFIVFHAGERFRTKSFLGKEIEPGAAHPFVHQRVRASVSNEARLKAFLENFFKLGLQSVDVRNAGRALRHPLSLFFFELQEIKIKSTAWNPLRPTKCFFGGGEQRKTGW